MICFGKFDFVTTSRIQLLHKFQAEEVSEAKRFTTAKLTITVRPVDANLPVVNATADEGEVEENSPKGTKVLDAKGLPIRLTVSDADLVSWTGLKMTCKQNPKPEDRSRPEPIKK